MEKADGVNVKFILMKKLMVQLLGKIILKPFNHVLNLKQVFKAHLFSRNILLSLQKLCQYTYIYISCAQVHELPQSHCGNNREGTLFS